MLAQSVRSLVEQKRLYEDNLHDDDDDDNDDGSLRGVAKSRLPARFPRSVDRAEWRRRVSQGALRASGHGASRARRGLRIQEEVSEVAITTNCWGDWPILRRLRQIFSGLDNGDEISTNVRSSLAILSRFRSNAVSVVILVGFSQFRQTFSIVGRFNQFSPQVLGRSRPTQNLKPGNFHQNLCQEIGPRRQMRPHRTPYSCNQTSPLGRTQVGGGKCRVGGLVEKT